MNDYLSVKSACQYLDISKSSFYRLFMGNSPVYCIPLYKIGNMTRFKRGDLEAAIHGSVVQTRGELVFTLDGEREAKEKVSRQNHSVRSQDSQEPERGHIT